MNMLQGLPYYVRVIVIGFGFIGGFWIAVGVNPEIEIIRAFAEWANSVKPNLGVVFWLIPVVDSVFSVSIAYALGGWLGLLATFIAFVGGLLFICCPLWGILFGGLGAVLGFFASENR